MTARILIHVQHLLGTGHLQRAGLIARALAARGAEVLLASGGLPVPLAPFPPSVEFLQLPPMRAADARFATLLDAEGAVVTDALRAARRRMLLDAFARFRPQAVVTETYPFGRRALRFELEPLIEAAYRAGVPLFASVRDILVSKPDPARRQAMVELARARYAGILVHADPRLVRLEDSLPEAASLGARLIYTGFVAPPEPVLSPEERAAVPAGEVVVTAGGGVAGADLLFAAVAARRLSRKHAATPWRLVTGRNLPQADFERLAALAPEGVALDRHRRDLPALFRRAALSISQAGYNTAVELLQARIPAIFVPFAEAAETEQTMRARLFAERGMAAMVEADALSPQALAEAIDAVRAPVLADLDPADLDPADLDLANLNLADLNLDGAAGSAAALLGRI